MIRIALLLMFVAIPALAGPSTRPAGPIAQKSCVTSQCHAGIKASRQLHSPVTSDSCDACHETVDLQAHTYRLKRQKAELCTYCHEFDVSAMPVIHKPVKEGECLGCHDPHGGKTTALMREDSIKQLCGRCHEDITHNRKFVHAPVKDGRCDACHAPHGSRYPRLMDLVGTDLCLACHKEFGQQLASAKFTHKALEKGCENCHDVHGSDQPMAVVRPTTDLCFTCHNKMKKDLDTVAFKHTNITADKACLACHTPHGGNIAKLAADLPIKLCMSCHKDPARATDGRTIPAVAEILDPALHKHGPIKDGQCGGCHTVHGGNLPELLAKPYSRSFYQRLTIDKYALCFDCHDNRLGTQEKTTSLTAFRVGDHNLHYEHANRGTRGRNCRACHAPHAGPNQRLVRQGVQFGKWAIPINFEKTATGGSCQYGCHIPYAYDREHPVGPTTRPSTRPFIVRAEHEQPRFVRFAAQDAAGAVIAVPSAGKVSILLFVGPADVQCQKLLPTIERILPEDNPPQVLIVACGPKSADNARAIASFKTTDWPVVADQNESIARAADVRGWPTILIVRPDALEIARLSGSAETLTLRLAAYLDAALSPLPAPLDPASLKVRSVGEESASRVRRELLQARASISQGKWDVAKSQLQALLKNAPSQADAHFMLGQVYEHEKDWASAAREYRDSRESSE